MVVKTYGQHVGSNIVYHHQVTNNGIRDVVGIAFGLDTNQVSSSLPYDRLQGELNFVMPIGLKSLDEGLKPDFISGPIGWTAEMIQIEHTGRYLQWNSSFPQSIQLGQIKHFSVTVPKYFEAYLTGHFSADYADGKDPWKYNGTMEKLDTTPPTPPTLTITPPPAILWPPNNKMVAVTAAITVQDDYDPQPEIQLESITSSEVLAQGDRPGAVLGTDDRQFSLAAERDGSSLAGRVYTLTYSATDGSGNQSTASTNVTVPHDQQ